MRLIYTRVPCSSENFIFYILIINVTQDGRSFHNIIVKQIATSKQSFDEKR